MVVGILSSSPCNTKLEMYRKKAHEELEKFVDSLAPELLAENRLLRKKSGMHSRRRSLIFWVGFYRILSGYIIMRAMRKKPVTGALRVCPNHAIRHFVQFE